MKNKKILIILILCFAFVAIIMIIINITSITIPVVTPIMISPEETMEHSPAVTVSSPISGQVIYSPVFIKGEVPGFWFFEASFPIKLYDENNRLIGESLAKPDINEDETWMTDKLVAFEAAIGFERPTSTKGTIVLEKDNPSGLLENAGEFRVPVIFANNIEPIKNNRITLKVYFNNSRLDPDISCNKVFSVDREVKETLAVARAAMNELILGPTLIEREAGYFSSFDSNVQIKSINIENGVARVDFNEGLEKNIGGSCQVAAIVAQINSTLKQFSSIKTVVISINGRSEGILQP